MKITFLGTGTSHGVPVIGCDCRVCKSPNPKNHRTRPSILVQYNGASVLVDTATELRLQALRNGISKVDAVLFTHTHADHIFGLDDLRGFNLRREGSIPCYGDRESIANIRRIFEYIFIETQKGGGKPKIELRAIEGRFNLFGLDIIPVKIMHGELPILGFRFNDVAYLTDCSRISDESKELLRGLRLMILDALRFRPHPTHFSLSEALGVVEELRPDRTLFTHICHDMDHDEVNRTLPYYAQLSYDGLTLSMGE